MLAVHDAALDDDGAIAERQPKIVEAIELERKSGFNLCAASADLLDRHRLEDHHFAVELAEDLNALRIPRVACARSPIQGLCVVRHPARL